jgi:hypothetical protein
VFIGGCYCGEEESSEKGSSQEGQNREEGRQEEEVTSSRCANPKQRDRTAIGSPIFLR